jgi:hypothetical protein
MAKKAKTAAALPSPVNTSLPTGFKAVRILTLPAFKLELNQPYVFLIEDKMHISDAKAAKGSSAVASKGKTMEPATVCHAVNVATGEKGTLIVSAVVKSVWEQEYANDGYVGKYFQIIKTEKREGKRYHGFNIVEVSPE